MSAADLQTASLISGTVQMGVGLTLLGGVLALVWLARTCRGLARVVGLELLAGLTTTLFVLLAIQLESIFFLEVALLLAIVGFLGTIAYARLAEEPMEKMEERGTKR